MADEIIRMEDIYADDIVGNINEVREARGTFESLDARLDNIDGNAPSPSTSDPAMDGTASPGSADTYSRGDHVHPTDTSRQAVIDSSHKLSSDLVDDTNNTNKFATAAQLQQITTNETNISSILDGATIDSFGDVETALSGKQATLTTAQLAAVNSGIDSTKVAQIETNKNNILYAQKTGVKNIMDLSKYKELNPSIVVGDNLVFHGITWSISNSSGLTVSGTADSSGSYPTIYSATLPIGTYYLTGGDSTVELLAPNNQHESGQGLTIEITASTTQPYIIRGYVPQSTAITETHNIKPMLRQVGNSTFEPYAMSNAELTAAIQALQAQLANQ